MTSAKDIYVFLTDRGGVFEVPASELHEHFRSNHKSKTAHRLSTKVEELARRIPVSTFERQQVMDTRPDGRSTSRRIIRLTLENGVNGVNGC